MPGSFEIESDRSRDLGQGYCPSGELSDGNGGYIGAFRNASDNWLEGWTNFDPQNTVY